MALTEKQKNELVSQYGNNQPIEGDTSGIDSIIESTFKSIKTQPEKKGGILTDIKGIGTGIKEAFTKRTANVGEIQKSNIGGIRKTFQNVGQTAGLISDVIGQTAIGGIKAATPEFIQKPAGEAITTGVKAIANTDFVKTLSESYMNLPPEKRKDVEAILGIGSLVGDIAGVGIATKGVKPLLNVTSDMVSESSKKAFKSLSNLKKTAGENAIISDILPTKRGIINSEVTKALDLTQGDAKNIYQSTGNQVGDFLAERNLIGDNIENTVKGLNDHFDTNFKEVRNNINQVNKVYNTLEVPRYTDALNEIKKNTKDVVGLEKVNSEVDNLLSKSDVSLNDIQRVKELMDEEFNLYKVTGDVAEGRVKKGLANMRNDIKTFIEKEVKDTTGSDIKALNNEVSTSKAILNAIDDRITRGSTRATITAGDVVTFLTGSGFGSPVGGVLAVLAKKLYQSPSFKLKFTKWFNSKSQIEKVAIMKDIENGVAPKGIKAISKSK